MQAKKVHEFICATLAVFVVISLLMATGLTSGFDLSVAKFAQSFESSIATLAMINISRLGDWYSYAIIALALVLHPSTRRDVGLPAVATLAASSLMNTILKVAFATPRPTANRLISITGYSFPSGHAMNSAAFIGACAIFMAHRAKSNSSKRTILSLSLAFIIAVGFSRIYLGVHNPSDVLAGFSAGFCICGIASLIFKEEAGVAEA
jgi:undecaprenyl-diphosphatase